MVRGLDGFIDALWRCAVLKGLREGVVSPDSGGYGEGETPLPIPNRAVKPLSADGTWLARARESRTPPVIPRNGPPVGGPFCVVCFVLRWALRSRLGASFYVVCFVLGWALRSRLGAS